MDDKQLKFELSTCFPRKLALLRAKTYVAYAQQCPDTVVVNQTISTRKKYADFEEFRASYS